MVWLRLCSVWRQQATDTLGSPSGQAPAYLDSTRRVRNALLVNKSEGPSHRMVLELCSYIPDISGICIAFSLLLPWCMQIALIHSVRWLVALRKYCKTEWRFSPIGKGWSLTETVRCLVEAPQQYDKALHCGMSDRRAFLSRQYIGPDPGSRSRMRISSLALSLL